MLPLLDKNLSTIAGKADIAGYKLIMRTPDAVEKNRITNKRLSSTEVFRKNALSHQIPTFPTIFLKMSVKIYQNACPSIPKE